MVHRQATARRRADARVDVATSQDNPWLGVALRSGLVTVGVGLVGSVIGAVTSSVPGLVSSLAAMTVVVVFFGISLVVAAYVGHKAPKAIMGTFMLTYVVKVIGFGALLLIPHDPSWFSRTWMTVSAVACVLAWQIVEVYLFSKLRLQIFSEESVQTQGSTGTHRGRHHGGTKEA
jgi:ATP synthase protein I